MTVRAFGVPRFVRDQVPVEWTPLTLGDATVRSVAGNTTFSEPTPGVIRATIDASGITPGDYPSRMDGLSWALDDVLDFGGQSLMMLLEVVDATGLPGTKVNVGVGAADNGGKSTAGEMLIGGVRYTSPVRGYASRRSGGGADTQSSAYSSAVVRHLVRLDAVGDRLNQVTSVGMTAANVVDEWVAQGDGGSTLGSDLAMVLYAGADAVGGASGLTIDVRVYYRLAQLPAVP